jgi:hypothetical protein
MKSFSQFLLVAIVFQALIAIFAPQNNTTMSEFQCYKYKTIDRPLTDSERRERILELRKEYARRTALISRWEKAGLFW